MIKKRERECPNEEFAREYAYRLEVYYDDVKVYERNGVWYVSYNIDI